LADEPIEQTCEFGSEQRAAFALIGTIPLPSPFPASARISIGIMPKPEKHGADPTPRFFLKLVEHVGNKKVVTRLVSLKDVRAVRFRSGTGTSNDPWVWALMTCEDLFEDLEKARKRLNSISGDPGSASARLSYEQHLPYGADGVVYVPETAPVLVRTEFGVPAAEAYESARLFQLRGERGCCPSGEPPVDQSFP
jgi:hypothetical protein